jgi:hypothetical protein
MRIGPFLSRAALVLLQEQAIASQHINIRRQAGRNGRIAPRSRDAEAAWCKEFLIVYVNDGSIQSNTRYSTTRLPDCKFLYRFFGFAEGERF